MRGMKDKGLVLWVPCCSGLQTAYIGTVPKLGLCITSNLLVVLRGLEEEFVLFWCTLVTKGGLRKQLVSTSEGGGILRTKYMLACSP